MIFFKRQRGAALFQAVIVMSIIGAFLFIENLRTERNLQIDTLDFYKRKRSSRLKKNSV